MPIRPRRTAHRASPFNVSRPPAGYARRVFPDIRRSISYITARGVSTCGRIAKVIAAPGKPSLPHLGDRFLGGHAHVPLMWGRMTSCGGLTTRPERRFPGRPLGHAQPDKLPHNRTVPHGHCTSVPGDNRKHPPSNSPRRVPCYEEMPNPNRRPIGHGARGNV